jgi:hypothetical protein
MGSSVCVFRFGQKQVNVFRHHDISDDDEAVALASLFQNREEAVAAASRTKKRQTAVAGGSDKVQVMSAVGSMQATGHNKLIVQGASHPLHRLRSGQALAKNARTGHPEFWNGKSKKRDGSAGQLPSRMGSWFPPFANCAKDGAPACVGRARKIKAWATRLRIPFRLLTTVLAACLLPTLASAEIVYKVTPSVAGDHLSIEMDFDVSAPTVELQMPSWLGGVYSLQDSWETLHDVTATDEAGDSLSVVRAKGDTWTISTAGHTRTIVRYNGKSRSVSWQLKDVTGIQLFLPRTTTCSLTTR